MVGEAPVAVSVIRMGLLVACGCPRRLFVRNARPKRAPFAPGRVAAAHPSLRRTCPPDRDGRFHTAECRWLQYKYNYRPVEHTVTAHARRLGAWIYYLRTERRLIYPDERRSDVFAATCGLRDKDLAGLPRDCISRETRTRPTGETYDVINMRGYKTKNRRAPEPTSWKVKQPHCTHRRGGPATAPNPRRRCGPAPRNG